jgi:hypothetical protein
MKHSFLELSFVNEPWKVVVNDGLYPNLSLCCGIGAHIDDLIVEKDIILIFKAFTNHYNYNKLITKYQFQWKLVHEILPIHKGNH